MWFSEILDIFSSFDPENMIFMNLHYLMWMALLISPIYLYSISMSQNHSMLTLMMNMTSELVTRSKAKSTSGSFTLFFVLFFMIVYFNMIGLAPYTFSWTSHMIVNFGLALTLWFTVVLMSATYDMKSFMAHLVPMGSPVPLAPFLVIIETVSISVRPITLAVRLTANIMTGHIIMTLLSESVGYSMSMQSITILMLMMIVSGYFMFEMAICVVQAYIFTLLPVLYLDEHV